MEEMYKKWKNEETEEVVENAIKKYMVRETGEVLYENELRDYFFKSVIDPLNKKIRKYDGDNSFMLSLQKGLRNSRNTYEMNGRKYKILSDKQYSAVKSIL